MTQVQLALDALITYSPDSWRGWVCGRGRFPLAFKFEIFLVGHVSLCIRKSLEEGDKYVLCRKRASRPHNFGDEIKGVEVLMLEASKRVINWLKCSLIKAVFRCDVGNRYLQWTLLTSIQQPRL